jgi:hypothetical protein
MPRIDAGFPLAAPINGGVAGYSPPALCARLRVCSLSQRLMRIDVIIIIRIIIAIPFIVPFLSVFIRYVIVRSEQQDFVIYFLRSQGVSQPLIATYR